MLIRFCRCGGSFSSFAIGWVDFRGGMEGSIEECEDAIVSLQGCFVYSPPWRSELSDYDISLQEYTVTMHIVHVVLEWNVDVSDNLQN